MFKKEMLKKYADSPVWHSRGYLPHFDLPGAYQFITYRTADSLPREAVLKIYQSIPERLVDERREALEVLLDQCYGACALRRPDVAAIVEENLLRFDGERYKALAWCIMPNHVHLLLRTVEGWALPQVLHSLKTYPAKAINRLLGQSGQFWQEEYFDRVMRDDDHLNRTIEYIENNPVVARLCSKPADWPFSSFRLRTGS